MVIAQQNTSGAPLKKKAKTSQSVVGSASPSVQKKISVSLLPTMPWDVLFEVCLDFYFEVEIL